MGHLIRHFPAQVEASVIARQQEYGLTRNSAQAINGTIAQAREALTAFYDAADRAMDFLDTYQIANLPMVLCLPGELMDLHELASGSKLPAFDGGNIKGGADAYPVTRWQREVGTTRRLTRSLEKALAGALSTIKVA